VSKRVSNVSKRVSRAWETRSPCFQTRFPSVETRPRTVETRLGSLQTRFPCRQTRFGCLETSFGSLDLGPFEQHDPGEAAELLLLALRHEPADEVPEPGPLHGAVEPLRLLPHRAELDLAPAVGREELRVLGGGEAEGHPALLHLPPPGPLHPL